MGNMPAWSFSSLTAFETCPRQYYLVKVAKTVKEQPSEHTEWGNRVHKALELRVKDGTPLPEGMEKWEPVAAKLATMAAEGRQVFTERRYALTRNLTPTEFFAPDCWHRGVIDVSALGRISAYLADYKTGKVKTDHDQLTISSAAMLQEFPQVERVTSQYIWLAHDRTTTKTITREDATAVWQDVIPRTQRMEAAFQADRWVPKPSGLCAGWCSVGRENCEFWCPKRK